MPTGACRTFQPAFTDWGKSQGGRQHQGWDKQHGALLSKHLEEWVDELKLTTLADIEIEEVEGAIAKMLAADYAPKTVLLKVQALKGLVNWAMRRR